LIGFRWWFTCPLIFLGRACERRVAKLCSARSPLAAVHGADLRELPGLADEVAAARGSTRLLPSLGVDCLAAVATE
jgi:hypothetical protein